MATASRERHFVVSASGPVDLDLILAMLAPGDGGALSQGRVVVDGKRADSSVSNIALGSRVTWVAPRLLSPAALDLDFELLDRDEDLLVVSKPAAWSSEPDRAGHVSSLRERVAERIGQRSVHIVTRLDAGVSGLVLVAVGETACRLSSKLQHEGKLEKQYLAITTGTIVREEAWNQPIDGTESHSFCHPLAQCLPVRFSTKLETRASLIRVTAVTGRHHQVRVHAANNGYPLLGDRRYGGPARYVTSDGTVRTLARPMLHAWKLEIHLPGRIWTTVCEAPADMRQLWCDLGGSWPAA